MSYFINNQQKINDIIFEKRNKNYGAYQLRSDYGYTLLFAVSSVLIGFAFVSGLAYYFTQHPNNQKPDHRGQLLYKDSVYVIPYVHKEIEPEKAENKKEMAQKTLANKHDELNANTKVLDSLDSEKSSELSKKTSTAAESNTNNLTGAINNTAVSTGIIIDETVVKEKHKTVKNDFEVDTPPEFEGGLKALYSFIAKNTRYPIDAIEAGQEGIVRVNFVVDENGQVSQLTLLNKKGFGLDDEALRVVGLLPKFKSPAMVKGEAVKVNFQLPIKFSLK